MVVARLEDVAAARDEHLPHPGPPGWSREAASRGGPCGAPSGLRGRGAAVIQGVRAAPIPKGRGCGPRVQPSSCTKARVGCRIRQWWLPEHATATQRRSGDDGCWPRCWVAAGGCWPLISTCGGSAAVASSGAGSACQVSSAAGPPLPGSPGPLLASATQRRECTCPPNSWPYPARWAEPRRQPGPRCPTRRSLLASGGPVWAPWVVVG